MIWSKLKNITVNLLFVPRCIICGDTIDVLPELSEIYCVCSKCRPQYESSFAELCENCNRSVSTCTCGVKIGRHEISPIAKAFYYKPDKEKSAQNKAIFSLKHTDDKRIAAFLSHELARSVENMLKCEDIDPDECLFTFVPRRREAIARDGFDQGRRLAYYVAREIGSDSGFKPLMLRRGGREQKKLGTRERRKNIEGALKLNRYAKRKLSGRTVCVVDDVVTSGATMHAAQKLLLSAGAERVVFACVSRSKSDK